MSVDPGAPLNYADEEPSLGSGDDVSMLDGHHKRPPGMPASTSGRRKRRRKAPGNAIVHAMLEMAAASRMRASTMMRNEDKYSINRCIRVLDEMQGVVDQHMYLLALDLFKNPNAREIFLSLKSDKRLVWLSGKCRVS